MASEVVFTEFVVTHGTFDIADPSSTRVTTNSVNMTSLATSLAVDQWLECPTGVREVMGSIPVGDSVFSLSHARDKLNIPSFLTSTYIREQLFIAFFSLLFLCPPMLLRTR